MSLRVQEAKGGGQVADLVPNRPKQAAQTLHAVPSGSRGTNRFRPCASACSIVSICVAIPTWHVSNWQP